MRFECDPDWVSFHPWRRYWIAIGILLLVCEFEVEELSHVSRNVFQIHLSECLSKANTFASREGNEAVRIPLGSLWRKVKR